MPNPDLTAALEASLELEDAKAAGTANPLDEVDPNSLAELWDRINDHLAQGLPELITDSDLLSMVRKYRMQRLRWTQEQDSKPPRAKRSSAAKAPTSIAAAIEDWS